MSKYSKEAPETIQSLFASIAHSYDRGNAVLSFQMHQRWNRTLVQQLAASSPKKQWLDLCCGTGEIGLTALKACMGHPCKLTFLDFCEEMLLCAKEKANTLPSQSGHSLSYLCADAQELPLANESFNLISLAYGIRNIRSPRKCLEEAYRVLEPGGTLGILELTEPSHPVLKMGHRFYLRHFLPRIGRLLTSNQAAYDYLCLSIQTFIKPDELRKILEEVGFASVTITPLSAGIATILLAKKSL